MSDFYEVTFAPKVATNDQCEDIALNKAGVIGGIGYGYGIRGAVPTLPNGWRAKWVNTKGMGNHGTLVLCGTNPRTREIAFQGKVKVLVSNGLSAVQAYAYLNSTAAYKMELAPLAGHLAKKGVATAVAAARRYNSRAKWEKDWGYPVPKEIKDLSWPRIMELSILAEAVMSAS